jgi:MFS family permease
VTLFATGIYAIVKAIATIFALVFFIDRAGRRKLLIIGACGASLAMWYVGGYIIGAGIDSNHPQERDAAAWAGIVMVYVYAVETL